MKRFLIILVFLFFSCAAIKPGVYLNGFSNNCSRQEISGRGVAQLKGDFQEATNKARASATSDLLEANQDILVSIYSELRSDAVSMRNGERFAKEFTKKITSMAYSTILKEKRFQEKVVGDHLVSYVCIDTDTFVKGLKETIKLRRKRFLTALDHYRAGMELDDPKKRLKWLDKAKQMLEDYGLQDEYFKDEKARRVVLYREIENQIGRAVEWQEHLYIQQKRRELKEKKK